MKRILTGMAVVTLLLAGCAQNETFDQVEKSNAIGFSTYTGVTRATEVTNANINEFGIVGYTNDGSEVSALNHVKYTGAVSPTNSWAPTSGTNATWPLASALYPIDFYAYYPQASNAASGLTSAVKTVSYTASTTASAQVDLLAAAVENRLFGNYADVQLAFKHILSQIKFKVSVGANLVVRIAKIEIVNVGEAATFDFAKVNNIGDGVTSQQSAAGGIWTQPATTSTVYDFGMTAANFTGADAVEVTNSYGNNLMLIPQATSGGSAAGDTYARDGAYIRVTYMMYNSTTYHNIVGKYYETNGNATPLATGSLFVKAAFRLDLANFDGSNTTGNGWLPGKRYTYTLKFGQDGGNGGYNDNDEFVKEDGSDSGTIVTDPTGTPVIGPGDPFLPGKPIVFRVDVGDWVDATGINVQ